MLEIFSPIMHYEIYYETKPIFSKPKRITNTEIKADNCSKYCIASSEQEAIDKFTNKNYIDRILDRYGFIESLSDKNKNPVIKFIKFDVVKTNPSFQELKESVPAKDFLAYCKQELFGENIIQEII